MAVGAVQRTGDLDATREGFGERQRALQQPAGKRFSSHELHDQEPDRFGNRRVADVIQRADVGMIERRNGACFELEALAQFRIGRQLTRQHFDRDQAIEAGIPGAIDFTHPTRAERIENLVRAKASTGHHAHVTGSRLWHGASASRRPCAQGTHSRSIGPAHAMRGAMDAGRSARSVRRARPMKSCSSALIPPPISFAGGSCRVSFS